jgi:hypothetical protein
MNFKFNGDWQFWYKLETLAQLNDNNFFGTWSYGQLREKSAQGLVDVTFKDILNDDTEPLVAQINTLNYIHDNQNSIMESLLAIAKSEYVYAKEFYIISDAADYIDEDTFPTLNNVNDLKKALGLMEIHIEIPAKKGFSYATYYFKCSWEEEHGFAVTLHKDRLLNYFLIGDFGHEKMFEDNGGDYQAFVTRDNDIPFKYYEPNPKYGKLKPKEKEANDWYPTNLIFRDLTDDFINFIETKGLNSVYKEGRSWVEIAIRRDNERLIRYILSKKPKNIHEIKEIEQGKYKEIIKAYLNNTLDTPSV